MLRDLSELRVGDPVVHAQHGIGRYGGLVNLDLGEGATEFLLLEYEAGDKLYVPVSQLEVISRMNRDYLAATLGRRAAAEPIAVVPRSSPMRFYEAEPAKKKE